MAPKPGIVVSRRAASFSFARADELSIEGCDPSIEFHPLRASVFDERDHSRAQSNSSLFVHQYSQELLELPLALRSDESALQQNGAQLIDQSRPLADQTVPRSVKRLHVELILALQFDEPHRRARRRLRDPLGVAIVVLLRLDIRADVFGRHQPHVVTVAGEDTAEVMGATARLHPDNAGRQLLRKPDQCLAPHLATHDAAPDESSPITLQTFLPRSTQRTEIAANAMSNSSS